MKTKKDTRLHIKDIFVSKQEAELGEKSEMVCDSTVKYIRGKKYKHICIYEHMGDEVYTSKLIKKLEEQGISVYTPQMIGETEMILIDEDYEVYEKEIDLFIIPGRAFTREGKRLGRGRGYYDRFLSQKLYKKSMKLGICFDFQVLSDIPTEKHDINMDCIITNSGTNF